MEDKMYYEDEPYYEPSIADEILIEYQQKMKDALLESVKNQIDNIKSENESLKTENKKLQELVNNIDRKERELEQKKNNLIYEVKRERLSKLMEGFQVIMYKTYSTTVKLPQCDKCDKDRRIYFKSPSGKDIYESCSCDVGKIVYVPREYICYEFKINTWDRKDSLAVWYKVNHDKDYDWCGYESSEYLETVYKEGMDYKDLNSYKTFFRSKEECQKYCDWLSSKNEITKASVPKSK
jgi:regulator of replication initiation timing